jgi:protein-tyrosine-phosphatase
MELMNILVLCTGNSARSILLEYILGLDPRITSFSAGSTPTGRVNPASVRLLERRGVETSGFTSKSWDVFATDEAPNMDAVITVCGNARDETCPIWPGAPLRAHWGVEDPADAMGTHAEIDSAFELAFDLLNQRAHAFLAKPIETMAQADLQVLLNEVATIGAV